jgi:hypothetical protein
MVPSAVLSEMDLMSECLSRYLRRKSSKAKLRDMTDC